MGYDFWIDAYKWYTKKPKENKQKEEEEKQANGMYWFD